MPESIFASPYHQAQLSEVTKDGQLYLATMDGDAYSVTNGIPDLTVPRALEGKAKQIHDFYSSTSEI